MKSSNENEYFSQLNRLWAENRKLTRFVFFTDVMYEWYMDFLLHRREYPVAVLGPDVPLALLLSFGARPLFLLGGSHEACAFSEELVPRDTDPVSRSVLGYLNRQDAPDFSDTLFVVPLVSDSMRKMAYLLKEDGKKVLTIDIPPVREDAGSLAKWERQMGLLASELEEHLCCALKERELRRNIRLVSKARSTLYEFLKIASEQEEVIFGSARMLVQNSFYCAPDLEEWSEALKELTREIVAVSAKKPDGSDRHSDVISKPVLSAPDARPSVFSKTTPSASDGRPRILLMGSPVYFPGYKIPFLIEEAGMSIWRNLDVSTAAFLDLPRFGNSLDAYWKQPKQEMFFLKKPYNRSYFEASPSCLSACGATTARHVFVKTKTSMISAWKRLRREAVSWYYANASSAFTANERMRALVSEAVQTGMVDGVVFHVLKGQVEPDFELNYFEDYFAKLDIPSFRLETDYQYQDIEQLRIRMEAFREMLAHRKISGQAAGRKGLPA